jgi:phospholipid-binding lipoprotein MlaA
MSHSFAGRARVALLVLGVAALAGCAGSPTRTAGDPLESANRGVYKFNNAVDRATLKPAAQAYDDVAPGWFKTGVGNFFTNLSYPRTVANQLLQGKVKAAGQDTARFLINLTLGWGGVLDVASGARLPHHDEDLGQTLGYWGVPPGPYLMMPLLGPTTLRDLPSDFVDRFLEPLSWYNYGNERWFALGLSLLDLRAGLLPLDAQIERVYDKYGFVRDAYLQRRLYKVYDGNPPEELLDDGLEDPDPDADAEVETPPADPGDSGAAPPSGPQ